MSSKTCGDTPSNVFRGFIDMPGHSRRYIFGVAQITTVRRFPTVNKGAHNEQSFLARRFLAGQWRGRFFDSGLEESAILGGFGAAGGSSGNRRNRDDPPGVARPFRRAPGVLRLRGTVG